MTPTPQYADVHSPPSRVSIIARLVPVFSLSIPMAGAGLCAWLLMGVLEAMRHAEAAGVAAVAGGMAQANLAITVTLYFGIFFGFIAILVMVIRAFTTTITSSPSAWFFAVAGMLALVPFVFLWTAQSVFLEGVRGGNISLVATNLWLFLRLTIGASAVLAPILLIGSFIPLPSVLRAKHKWAAVVLLVLIEFALIGTAVVFQMRTAWLYRAREMEQL